MHPSDEQLPINHASAGGSPKYAGFWVRALAYLIDAIPITLATAAVFYFCFGFDENLQNYFRRGPRDVEARRDFLAQRNFIRDTAMGLYILYAACLESSSLRGTLGKRMLGLIVADREGRPISFGRAMARNLCKLLSALPFGMGYFRAGWSPKKQAWHDSLASTFVVEGRPDEGS